MTRVDEKVIRLCQLTIRSQPMPQIDQCRDLPWEIKTFIRVTDDTFFDSTQVHIKGLCQA